MQTKRTLKARITELENGTAALQGKLTAAEHSVKLLTIDGPLKKLAESMSTAPAALVAAFNRSYKLQAGQDGELVILTAADDKPVLKDGKPLPFERTALTDLLLSSEGEDLKLYKSILIVSRASGAAVPANGGRPISSSKTAEDRENKGVAITFGLK